MKDAVHMKQLTLDEEVPLKWPDGWERTPIQDRKAQPGWKRPLLATRDALSKELQRMGATSAAISRNDSTKDRLDPGVAVYFSRALREDFSWQAQLGITNPAPTLEEIDTAYREKAKQHHPDRGGDIEIFKKLGEYRAQARAWVMGTHGQHHEYVIACDKFTEPRLNMNAIRLAIAAFRQLDRVGVSSMLERTLNRAFKTALPAHASKESHASTA
jgi:hypothetical protein